MLDCPIQLSRGTLMKILITIFSLFLLIGGCTSVPVAEFQSYTDAYTGVKTESENLLVELDSVFKLSDAITAQMAATKNKKPVRPFPLEATGSNNKKPGEDDVLIRRHALDLITLYNDTLSRLAAGQSPEQVRSSANSLISGLNTFGTIVNAGSSAVIPFAGEVAALLGTVVHKLQEAHNRAQFVDALRNGAPILAKIFAQLQTDANLVYRIRALDADKRTLAVQQGMVNNIEQMLLVAKNSKAPTSAKDIKTFKTIQGKLANVIKAANIQGAPAIVASGNDISVPLLISQLQQTLSQLESSATQYQAIVDEINASLNWVQSYKRMVKGTNTDLNAVVIALDKPVDLTAIASQIGIFVFQVRRDFQALQTARAAAAKG